MVVINETVEDVKGSDVDRSKQANNAKEEGNKLFRAAQYEDALLQYELALQIASEVPLSAELCSICHGNRAVCFLKLGKLMDTITECTKALELNPSYTKVLLKRGEAHEKLENYEDAISDMKEVMRINPNNGQAIRSMLRLKRIAREKGEKSNEEMIDMKKAFEIDPKNDQATRNIKQLDPIATEKQEEMIGKLKEMVNPLLGRFGLSTDNFKAVKDPNTGSYSISFQK